jgi:hypothetical protein
MLGIALSTSIQFVGGEGVLVFTESSNRLATIARNAKALTVSKIGGRNKPIVSLVQAFLVKVAHGKSV